MCALPRIFSRRPSPRRGEICRRALTPLHRNGTGRLHEVIDPGEYRLMIRLRFRAQPAAQLIDH